MNEAIDFIRKRRIRLGVKQIDCAKILNLAPSSYNEIEHKRNRLSADDFIVLCNFLKIDLREFQSDGSQKILIEYSPEENRVVQKALSIINSKYKN